MNARTYRFLIVASFAFLGLAMVADGLANKTLPAELRTYLQSQLRPTGAGQVLALVYLGAVVATAVGLYRFQSWSRPLALILTLAAFLLEPVLGPRVQSGWASALLDFEVLSWGMVLALSYWSPVAGQFSVRPAV